MAGDQGAVMGKTILLFVSLCLLIGCSNAVEPPPGAFNYEAYDSTGALGVTGWLTITITDSSHIAGEWHFKKAGNPEAMGPQLGSGVHTGGFYNGNMNLNLNPQMIDNNLVLSGTFTGNTYRGKWMWITFAGETNHGSFRAVRE